MAFASQKNDSLMNSSYNEIPNWNNGYGSVAFNFKDYWNDYRPETSQIKVPVLFFLWTYRLDDWPQTL